MKSVMTIKDEKILIEEPLKLYDLNFYLSLPKQRQTERINIIADDNHLE